MGFHESCLLDLPQQMVQGKKSTDNHMLGSGVALGAVQDEWPGKTL